MKLKLIPTKLSGEIKAPASKSFLHRYLIAAAFGNKPCFLNFVQLSDDIEATVFCLKSLGAVIEACDNKLKIIPCQKEKLNEFRQKQTKIDFYINESGTTYRFFIAIAAVLGLNSYFHIKGSLKHRPMKPIFSLLKNKGLIIVNSDDLVHITGKLKHGNQKINADISSQFVSGLLMAAAITKEEWTITAISQKKQLPSKPYIDMTLQTLKDFNIHLILNQNSYTKPKDLCYETVKCDYHIEGDWSNAAFFLVSSSILQTPLTITGLNPNSLQGDKRIIEILKNTGVTIKIEKNKITCIKNKSIKALDIDIDDIPDLLPALAILASFANNTSKFNNIERLRYKESNRIDSITSVLKQIGVIAYTQNNSLYIKPDFRQMKFAAEVISSNKDHRIAMMISIIANLINDTIIIEDADAVSKSYPTFWNTLDNLGNKIEKQN